MSRVLMFFVAAISLVLSPVQQMALAQGFKLPPQWLGTVSTTLTDDRAFGLLTFDVVGGLFDVTPGSEPDGSVDWMFLLVKPASAPPAFAGRATLRVPEIRGFSSGVEYLEVVPATGSSVLFRKIGSSALPQRPTTRTIDVCWIGPLYQQTKRRQSHEQAVKSVLAGSLNEFAERALMCP